MSTYDSYETVEVPRRHRSHRHHHHHDDREEPRYVETSETYARGPSVVSEPSYLSSRQDLALRGREDSDLSVEEVRREFPPPGFAEQRRMVVRDERYAPTVRSRSADRSSQYGAYLGDPRRSERDLDGQRAVDKKSIHRHRSLSSSKKIEIAAAVTGAALALGGKELWDYRQAKEHGGKPKDRNILATAAVGAAGAFAGYEGAELYNKKFRDKKELKESKQVATYDRDGHLIEYYSDDEDKPKKGRRKSIIETLGLGGIGAAAAKAIGGHDDDRSDRRSRRGSDSSHGSRRSRGTRREKSPGDVAKLQQAAKAALIAGATEAFRVRNEPGGWAGAKGKRILTAAIGAGGVGAAAAGDDPEHNSKLHLLEAVIGGLATNRLVNGSRNDLDVDEDGKSIRGGRSRSRSRAPSRSGGLPLAALGTAALGALAAKKAHDHSRSRSRGDGDRRRSGSEDSLDSGRDRRHRRSRSKSVTDYARNKLASLGIGEGTDDRRDDRRDRGRTEETHSRKTRSHRGSRDLDSSDDEYDHRRGDYDDDRRSHRGSSGRNRRVAEGKQNISDSDSLGSSTGDDKRIMKMKGKQFLTAGLATAATIHAANTVYRSVQKRKAGHKAIAEGEMTAEEARKQIAKARLQGAASIGIAALGIKGAISGKSLLRILAIEMFNTPVEWKDMNTKRLEYRKAQAEREERHEKRIERQRTIRNGDESDRTGLRPHNRRQESFPNKSTPDLSYDRRPTSRDPTYYDNDDPYRPHAQQYGQHLPPPPMGYGYDYDKR